MRILLKFVSLGCFFLSLFLIFIGFFHPITALNEDLGRHIVLGNLILQQHTVPKINLFSYTYASYPFINSHWLSEVVFAGIVRLVGLNGLLLFATLVTLLTFSLMMVSSMKKNPFLAVIFGAGLYSILLLERTDIRPELFSFLFLAVFLTILYRYREAYTPAIFLLVPIELAWVNMHIYFILGVLVPILFFVDMLVIHKFRLSVQLKRLGLVIILLACATFCNPNTIAGALFPFTYSHNYGLVPIENHALLYVQNVLQTNEFFYAEIIMGALFLLLCISYRCGRLIDWLLSVTFSILFFLAIRNLPLFIYGTFIPFVYTLNHTSSLFRNILAKYGTQLQLSLLQTSCFFSLFLILTLAVVRIVFLKGVGWGTNEFMKASVDFFIAHQLHGPLYNDINIGSYLTYRLYPRERVFVDPRPEAYPSSFFTSMYIPMKTNQKVFDRANSLYQFNSIIFSLKEQSRQTIQLLLHQKQYALVYLDENGMILVKRDHENAAVIHHYAITQETFHVPYTAAPDALVNYLYFFDKAGWKQQELEIYHRLLAIDPRGCLVDTNDILERVSELQTIPIHLQKQCP